MESIFTSPEFQMSLLLFVALGGYLIASRINQSAVIGLILVGIVVGPSMLGWITYTDFVRGLAHLGAVVLLFVIGLEFNLKDILSARNGIIAAVGVIVPWIGGYWLSLLFGYDMPSAIFIGTALTATSIAITANVLKELGKLQTEAAKVIIGAAVIDDVLSLLALAISTDVVSGTVSAGGIAIVAIKAIAFIVIAGAFGLLVVSRFMERLDTTAFAEKYPEFIFIFAMMMAFLYAMLAEVVGLSAIVGAFIAGVSFEGVRLQPQQEPEGRGRVPSDHLCIDILCIVRNSRRFPCLDPRDNSISYRPHHRCNHNKSCRVWHPSQTFRTVHQGCTHCRVRDVAPWRGGDDRRPYRA